MRTIKDISQQLGVNEETVRRWIRSGELKAKQIGRSYCVEDDSFKRFIEGKEGVVGALGSAVIGPSLPAAVGSTIGGVTSTVMGVALSKITHSLVGNEQMVERRIEKLERVRKKLSLEYELLDFELEEQIRELKDSHLEGSHK